MTKLLVFGQTGQVAQELARLASDALFLDRQEADFADPGSLAALVEKHRPHVVINAAAYTAVDRAETEHDTAKAVNADSPGAIARVAAQAHIPFLHISTDYVFDGSGNAPRAEDAPTHPLGVYGATKLAGEDAIAMAGGRWVILRTSWVFSSHGANFVKTMLRLGAERDELSVVGDQIGGPTAAAAIARALLVMAERLQHPESPTGIYHFSGAPDVSWADFAREIFRQAGLPCKVRDIPTAEYPTPARRPHNSRLDCAKLARDFGIERPDWRLGLAEVIEELNSR